MDDNNNKNLIWIIDAIEECGSYRYPDIWPNNKWQNVKEPRYKSENGKIINKEQDSDKANTQEKVHEILMEIHELLREGHLKAFTLNNDMPQIITNKGALFIPTIVKNNGKIITPLSSKSIEKKPVFLSIENFNECIYPFNFTKNINKKKTETRGRKKGDGQIDDTEHLKYMTELIANGKANSPNQAAELTSMKYTKSGDVDPSFVRRISRKYKNQQS